MKLKNSSKEADPASTGLGIDVSNHDTRGLVKPVSAPSSPVPVSAAKLSKESQRPSLLVTPAAADVKPLSGVKVSIAKDLYVRACARLPFLRAISLLTDSSSHTYAQNRENDIRDLVISLGGDFLGPYESRCTHFVQEGWGSKTEPKELRLARHKGKNVVGLGWLLAVRVFKNPLLHDPCHGVHVNSFLSASFCFFTPGSAPAKESRWMSSSIQFQEIRNVLWPWYEAA
jgi:hypothetical protein